MTSDDGEELKVTFNPPLYLQRQKWLLDALRREAVQSILDIGCGEGSLLQCLTVPPQFKPPVNLPPTSPFVSGPTAEYYTDLHLKTIHGLDPCPHDLELAIQATALPTADDLPFTGYERWRTRQARWTPLEVILWEGGFENLKEDFKGDRIDAFVASEVIEHLPPDLFPLFAPILFGYYRPRLVLLTTPNYTYNQRFSRPEETSPTGFPDPTGRTNRVFRHHDHKFEWTSEEWSKFCTDTASGFGYSVYIGGVGQVVEPDPWDRDSTLGFASQVAVFRRLDIQSLHTNANLYRFADAGRPILRAHHVHLPHPLSLEDLNQPPVMADIRQAVKDAMNDSGEGAMTFECVWRQGVVSLKCTGDIAALVKAFGPETLDEQEWSILDDAKGWDAVIVWKKFGANPQSSPYTLMTMDGSVMPERSQTGSDLSRHSDEFPDGDVNGEEAELSSTRDEDAPQGVWEAGSSWGTSASKDDGVGQWAWRASLDETRHQDNLLDSTLNSSDEISQQDRET